MDFTEAEQKRIQFSTRLQSGQLTPAQYAKAVTSLQVTDARGTIWQPNPSGDGWIFWNGSAWQPGLPPGIPGPGMVAGAGAPQKSAKDFNEFKSSLMTVDEFKKISKDVPLAKRPQKWWDLLSILGGVVAAIIWFLYGGIRSGREGFDLLTPLLMIAIPVILVWFRTDIDQILLPLQPHRKKISKIILIGLGIAIPFLTAWLLYNIFHISQYPLMQANIVIGTMVSYALVRDPIPAMGKNTRKSGPPSTNPISIIFFVMLASLIAIPVMADDCARDPLNAQDCLRTGVYAETMAGAAAAGLGILVNGPIILQGILAGGAGGAASGAGSGGSSGGSGTIYGTGKKGDPFRDGNTLGEIGPDGKFVPYPENADKPPVIFGTGTPQDPYTNIPPPVFDPTPTPPDVPPVDQPETPPAAPDWGPLPPSTSPPVSPRSPVVPEPPVQPPVVPAPPEKPLGPPIPPELPPEPPAPPEQPPEPPAPPEQPPEPPKPPELTPAQKQELMTQRTNLEQGIFKLQEMWKRKKWLETAVPEAYKQRAYQALRAGSKPVQDVVDIITDPKKAAAKKILEKVGIKTAEENLKAKNPFTKTGVDIPQSEIIDDFKNADTSYRDLKKELDNMPTDEQMKDQMKRFTQKISVIDGKLAGGK
ncbi:MAG: hypothetical protein Q7T80_10900 [Methanoregula sp.]|nr:hypothetical protein [Methanoregula sp.]